MPEYNLFAAISNLVSYSVPGDFIDNLNCKVTPLILINLATLLAIKQFVFKPIQCWVPAEYTGAWEEYVENYCWVQNTYYLPQNASVPEDTGRRSQSRINYYQWVPFILLLQAILFALPYLLWNALCTITGINVHMILKMSCECQNSSDIRIRDKFSESLAIYFDRSLVLQQQNQHHRKSFFNAHIKPVFIVGLYSVTKILSLVNVFSQFFLLDGLLGTGDLFYGLKVLIKLCNGQDWQVSGLFPRVTLCDFYKRVIANIHLQTVQCVLPANMLHEKVFLLVWWWLVVMATINVVSLVHWLLQMLPSRALTFVHSLLDPQDHMIRRKDHGFNLFVLHHLGRDGLVLLHFIYIHQGAVVTSDLISILWNKFNKEWMAYKANPLESYGIIMGTKNLQRNTVVTTPDFADIRLPSGNDNGTDTASIQNNSRNGSNQDKT